VPRSSKQSNLAVDPAPSVADAAGVMQVKVWLLGIQGDRIWILVDK